MPQQPEVPVGATKRLDVGGRALNVWRAGDSGPLVLFVHGIPTNHMLWHDVIPEISREARIVAVDMLGYGCSDAPNGWPVDIASQAGYVLSLLDALGVDRVAVVGHDLGGGVAQTLAATNGDRVTGICVIDGVCFDGWPVPLAKAMKLAWPVLRYSPPRLVARSLQLALRTLFADPDQADRFSPWFIDPWRAPDGPERLAQHLRSLDSVYTQAVAPFLPRLAMPAELVWGRRDHQMKPKYAERLSAAIPGARLTWVEDASHFVPADAPEEVVAAVRRLLARK